MLIPGEINWRLHDRIAFSTRYQGVFRDDEAQVTCEYITVRTDNGNSIGQTRKWFYIDNDPREFLTEQEMCDAYNEKFKRDGDSPTTEVKYIKVIVNKLPVKKPTI